MKYQLPNGKHVTIDDGYLKKNMEVLNLTKEEAIQQWLEDEGYLVNEEQEALIEKTKGQKLHENGKSDKPKQKRSRTVKVDETKINVIRLIKNVLEENGYENVNIENEQKIITFSFEDCNYKIDLIKKRS